MAVNLDALAKAGAAAEVAEHPLQRPMTCSHFPDGGVRLFVGDTRLDLSPEEFSVLRAVVSWEPQAKGALCS